MSIIDDCDILKGVNNVVESTDTDQEKQEQINIKTVSEAIRLHDENVNVRGMIVAVSVAG